MTDAPRGVRFRVRGLSGEGQNRTADTAIFSRVLCQLSYLAMVRCGRCRRRIAMEK